MKKIRFQPEDARTIQNNYLNVGVVFLLWYDKKNFMKTYKDITDYISKAPPATQDKLKLLRQIVNDAAPGAIEEIAYGMPAFSWRGKPLFYFAAMKSHLGLYPTPGPIVSLNKELTGFSFSKGCIRVPYNLSVPEKLVTKLVKARIKEIKGG